VTRDEQRGDYQRYEVDSVKVWITVAGEWQDRSACRRQAGQVRPFGPVRDPEAGAAEQAQVAETEDVRVRLDLKEYRGQVSAERGQCYEGLGFASKSYDRG
jgi:hypothetical protein